MNEVKSYFRLISYWNHRFPSGSFHIGRDWSYTVYGISAQGGKLDEDKERLLSIELPSDRIIIVGNEASQHDISAPVQWLLQSVT